MYLVYMYLFTYVCNRYWNICFTYPRRIIFLRNLPHYETPLLHWYQFWNVSNLWILLSNFLHHSNCKVFWWYYQHFYVKSEKKHKCWNTYMIFFKKIFVITVISVSFSSASEKFWSRKLLQADKIRWWPVIPKSYLD